MIASMLTAWFKAPRTRMSWNGVDPSASGRSVFMVMFQLSVLPLYCTKKSSLSRKVSARSGDRATVMSASSASSAATRLSGSGRTICWRSWIQGVCWRCVEPASTW